VPQRNRAVFASAEMSLPPSSDVPNYDSLVLNGDPRDEESPTGWFSDGMPDTPTKISIPEEHTPLLYKAPPTPPSQKLVEVDMVRDEIEDSKGKLAKFEFLKILKMSGPVIFAYMLQNSLQTGSILVVGRLVRGKRWFHG